MNVAINNLLDIRKKGLDALNRKLGPLGMVRFLQQYETGQGDYTRDRHLWLSSYTSEDIKKDIKIKSPAKKR